MKGSWLAHGSALRGDEWIRNVLPQVLSGASANSCLGCFQGGTRFTTTSSSAYPPYTPSIEALAPSYLYETHLLQTVIPPADSAIQGWSLGSNAYDVCIKSCLADTK